MNTQNNNVGTGDKKPAARPEVIPSGPEFRSVAIQRPTSLAGVRKSAPSDIIDKKSYFQPEVSTEKSKDVSFNPDQRLWYPTQLRPVPTFYPLERSSRFVEDEVGVVVSRISEANRLLSIHAVYCNETATADLYTAENVEMYLSLWKTSGNQQGIVIEIQRRKGDSIHFHKYSRCILDAAVGELNMKELIQKNGDDIDIVYTKKIDRLLNLETERDAETETDNAVVAVEIAHGLLMKDRMDARQLGLESLCLLTDPRKTGNRTALIASHVVLLGTAKGMDCNSLEPEEDLIVDETPFQEIRESILSLVQFRRIGEECDYDHEAEACSEDEHITVLHNLALAVLANALDVISKQDGLLDGDSSLSSTPEEEVPTNRRRLDTSESISERFLDESLECSGGSEDKEIMKTLISELGKANLKPHNACLSAKCLKSLCRASNKARSRAKELGAKTVVQTALDVGARTHLKLERECSHVMTELTQTNSE